VAPVGDGLHLHAGIPAGVLDGVCSISTSR
jgi:hypothetical protein